MRTVARSDIKFDRNASLDFSVTSHAVVRYHRSPFDISGWWQGRCSKRKLVDLTLQRALMEGGIVSSHMYGVRIALGRVRMTELNTLFDPAE